MLTIPAPYPDEIDRGFLGRIGRYNGITDTKKLLRSLRASIGQADDNGFDSPLLDVLSRVSNTKLSDFIHYHSLLPFRMIANRDRDCSKMTVMNRTFIWTQGTKAFRNETYFCIQCVKEDIEFHGESYWRRDHQLLGKVLCAKHHESLSFTSSIKAYEKSPAAFLSNSQDISKELAIAAINSGAYERFFYIWEGLADYGQGIFCGKFTRVLKMKARAQGFYTTKSDFGLPLVSDEIIKVFGRDFIELISAKLASKNHNEKHNEIDGRIIQKGKVSLFFYYVLLATVLFYSGDEALITLIKDEDPYSNLSKSRTGAFNSPIRSVEAYINKKQLSHNQSNLENAEYAKGLAEFGLPEIPYGIFKALSAFYLDNKNIEDSVQEGGVDLEYFLEILRQPGKGIVDELRRVNTILEANFNQLC